MPEKHTSTKSPSSGENTGDSSLTKLKQLLTHEQKTRLRKQHEVDILTKQIIYNGVFTGEGAHATIQQFHKDLMVYGLYTTLLYVENYEESAFYIPGTAKKAALCALGIDEFTPSPPPPEPPAPFTMGAVIESAKERVAYKKVGIVNESRFNDAVNGNEGWCVMCQDFTRDECEPDARCYECPKCGKHTVYGAGEALLSNFITFGE